MNTPNYKYMFKTEFRCFAEHYNEFIDYITKLIAENDEEDDIDTIIIDGVNMQDDFVEVTFHYTYDEDERILDLDFNELNK